MGTFAPAHTTGATFRVYLSKVELGCELRSAFSSASRDANFFGYQGLPSSASRTSTSKGCASDVYSKYARGDHLFL